MLRANGEVIERDPRTVALAAALIHVHDQVTWGVLPASVWRDSAIELGATLAGAVAGTPTSLERYRTALAAALADAGDDGPAVVIPHAMALGLADKWTRATAMLATVAAEPSG
jgi:hypothetical protein